MFSEEEISEIYDEVEDKIDEKLKENNIEGFFDIDENEVKTIATITVENDIEELDKTLQKVKEIIGQEKNITSKYKNWKFDFMYNIEIIFDITIKEDLYV